MVIYTLLFHVTGGSFLPKTVTLSYHDLFYMLILLVILVVVHEGLHGLTWAVFCKNRFKSIQFGLILSSLTPYCTCLEPLGFKTYLLGGMMPLMVLGFGSFGISLITGSCYWFYFACVATLTAGGDITIALMLLQHRDALLLDHPTECGFYAFEKESKEFSR
jgi:hypothetical protein